MTSQLKKKHQDYVKNLISKSKEKIQSQVNQSRTSDIVESFSEKSEVMKEYEKSFGDFTEQAADLKNSTEQMIKQIDEQLKLMED